MPLPWLLLAAFSDLGWSSTPSLRAALPGLSMRRALTLSLTGSAVANVLPVGGAAGIVLNHRMTRSWPRQRRVRGVHDPDERLGRRGEGCL
ncbi:MAG: hypothetical protein R2734_05130 [Nocardioides sp.]